MPDHRQVSQEFRLESEEWGRFDWQAGLFWYDEDITIDNFNYDSLAPGNPQAGRAIQQQRNKTWAVFASGDFDVTDAFKLRGGVRYTQDEKDFSASVLESAPFGAPVAGPYTVTTDVDDVRSEARRLGQTHVIPCRSRRSPLHYKHQLKK